MKLLRLRADEIQEMDSVLDGRLRFSVLEVRAFPGKGYLSLTGVDERSVGKRTIYFHNMDICTVERLFE